MCFYLQNATGGMCSCALSGLSVVEKSLTGQVQASLCAASELTKAFKSMRLGISNRRSPVKRLFGGWSIPGVFRRRQQTEEDCSGWGGGDNTFGDSHHTRRQVLSRGQRRRNVEPRRSDSFCDGLTKRKCHRSD